MITNKYFGLLGIILSVVALFAEVAYQNAIPKELLIVLIIITLYTGVVFWQYTFYANWKKSFVTGIKITVLIVVIGLILGLLKRFLK